MYLRASSIVNPATRGKLLVRLHNRRQSAPMARPVMLIIRDGWGINPGSKKSREANGDATLLASTPCHD